MIRLEPEIGADLPTVWFTHDHLPDQRFRLWMPEGFYRARKTAPAVAWGEHGAVRCWYTTVWPGEDPFELTTEVIAEENQILLSVAVRALPHENSQLDLWRYRGVTLGPCLALKDAPMFHQGRGERTYLALERGLTAAADTRRLTMPGWDGWFRNVQTYMKRAYVDLRDGQYHSRFEDPRLVRTERGHPIGWGISPDLLAEPFICTEAVEGGYSIATFWQPGLSCSVNLNDDPHCIHAHPVIDEMGVGDTCNVRGKIYLAHMPAPAMLERYESEPDWRHGD